MKTTAIRMSLAIVLGSAGVALAQFQTPQYNPQSPFYSAYGTGPGYYGNVQNYNYAVPGYNTPPNYDPYQFNPYTGRWDYMPIPPQERQSGPNYNPYQFNWSSGQWDYRPVPSPTPSSSLPGFSPGTMTNIPRGTAPTGQPR